MLHAIAPNRNMSYNLQVAPVLAAYFGFKWGEL